MSLHSLKEKFLSIINTKRNEEENPFMEEENRKTDENSPLLHNDLDDVPSKEPEEEPTLKQKFLDFSRTVIVKKKSLKKRIKYYVPAIGWLPKYEYKKNLVLDIISGITIGVLLVPVALSYAVLIGLPPIYGLQASFYPLIIYFLFGTSRQMSIGPEAIVSILTATALDLFEDQSDRTGLAMAITFFTGLFTFALGLFRFGFLAQILSRPLLCGFINAVALEIMFEQSDKFFGLEFPEVHSFKKFWSIFEHWIDVNYPTLLLGLACVAALLLFRLCKSKIKRAQKYLVYVPDSFILVVVGILLAKFLNLQKEGVAILGENKAGFLAPRWPRLNISEIPSVASSSLVIAIIGVVESILCAQTYADKHKYRVSANRELVAVGLVNFIGSFFQIFPAFGSLARTSINDSAGAKSQTGALFSIIVVLSAILFFLPYFANLPKVVMGAIIVNAAIGLLEIHDVIFLWKLRAKVELTLFAVTFLATLILGVETGIITSIIISVFLIIKQTSMPHIAILKQVPTTKKFEELVTITDINLFEDKHTWFTLNAIPGVDDSGVLTVRIDASLYFANIGQLKELFQKLEQRSKVKLCGVIIDASSIPNIDASALQILIEIIEEWKSRGIKVCFLKLRPETKAMFFKAGIITLIGSENFFAKATDALDVIGGRTLEYSSYL